MYSTSAEIYLNVLEKQEHRDQILNRTLPTKLQFSSGIQLSQPLEEYWIIIYPIKMEMDTSEWLFNRETLKPSVTTER